MKMSEQLIKLRKAIPSNLISQKRIKGNAIDFVSWFNYCDLLDERVDTWEWEVVNMLVTDERFFVSGKLTIHAEDCSLSQMATGTEELNCSSYGDPSSNAEAMALRRCCAKFGLSRELWKKEHSAKNSPSLPFKGKNELTKEEFKRRFRT